MSRKITLIFGKTGTGKSTKAKSLIKESLSSRIIVIDALAEYDEFIIVENFLDFYEYVKDNQDFKLACRFSSDMDIEYLFKIVFELGNILLIVEEAEIYISPYAKQSNFLRLVRYGRHKNISIIGIARRAAELSIDLRANTDNIISFKQTELTDIEIMKKIGFENLNNLNEFESREIFL